MSFKRKALIIGAGPAGLTAAYELLAHTDVQPIVFEASGAIVSNPERPDDTQRSQSSRVQDLKLAT